MPKGPAQCLQCGTRIALFRKLKDSEFCSEEHRQEFQQDQQRLALERLIETEKLLTRALATRSAGDLAEVSDKRAIAPSRGQPQLSDAASVGDPCHAGAIAYLPGFASAGVALSTVGTMPWPATAAIPAGPPIQECLTAELADGPHVEESFADPSEAGPLPAQIEMSVPPDAVPRGLARPIFSSNPSIPTGPEIDARRPERWKKKAYSMAAPASNGWSRPDDRGVMTGHLRRNAPQESFRVEPEPVFWTGVKVPKGPEIQARQILPRMETRDPAPAGMLTLAELNRAVSGQTKPLRGEMLPQAGPATILVPGIPSLKRTVLESYSLLDRTGLAEVTAKTSAGLRPPVAADALPGCAVQLRLAERKLPERQVRPGLPASVRLQPFGRSRVPVESSSQRGPAVPAVIATGVGPDYPRTAIFHIPAPGLHEPLVFLVIPADMQRVCRTHTAILDGPPAVAIPGLPSERLIDPDSAELLRTEREQPIAPVAAPLLPRAVPIECPGVPMHSGLVVDPRRQDSGPAGSLLDLDWAVAARPPSNAPSNAGTEPLPTRPAVERPRLAPNTPLASPRESPVPPPFRIASPSSLKRLGWAVSRQFTRFSSRALIGAGAITLLILLTAPAASLSKSANGVWLKESWQKLRVRAGERASMSLSEDFRSGLDGWTDTENPGSPWTFDVNGFVQPGKLAIYKASEGLTDYSMEFLGQIDQKAMGWVLRARDSKNYYAAKLIITKPGPLPTLVLRRYAVVNGKETTPKDTVLPMTVRGDPMFQVKSDVAGADFSVRIQGHLVVFWTDTRFRSGGVGFFSSKGERSKIRWVHMAHNDDLLGRICAYLAPNGPSNDRVLRESGNNGETH